MAFLRTKATGWYRWFFPLMLIFFLLQSCSTSYVYKNLDWLLLRYVDDYVDLTPIQKKSFSQYFYQLQKWHKETELKRYQSSLIDIRRQFQEKHTVKTDIIKTVVAYRQSALEFLSALVAEAEPNLQILLKDLSDQQKQVLIKNIKDSLSRRYEKKLAMGVNAWQRDKREKMEKGLQTWLGKLTQEQKLKIQLWSKQLLNLDKRNQSFRLEWLALLEQSINSESTGKNIKLTELITAPDSWRTPEHLDLLNKNRQLTYRVIADILASRTIKQNQHALDEIDTWLKRIEAARG